MLDFLLTVPGRLYVVATLLPLLAFTLLLLTGLMRRLSVGTPLHRILGGEQPRLLGALIVLAAMASSATIGVTNLQRFLADPAHATHDDAGLAARWSERMDWFRLGSLDTDPPPVFEKQRQENPHRKVPRTALALELGYRIDHLSAVLFAMVTVVGTLIVMFSIGYMKDERNAAVEDHEVEKQTPTVHRFHRRGRFGRFFLFLSLFCFSMLNLLIADNLFQIFVSWELVGLCSFFLIGFYYERPSASYAANKAFIMNRIGDAGFLVAIMIAWTSLGTLNIEEMKHRLRSPAADSHGKLDLAEQFVRVNLEDPIVDDSVKRYSLPAVDAEPGTHLALFPLAWEEADHFHGLGYKRSQDHGFEVPDVLTFTSYGAMPYWLFVAMGLGLFLGCVGKSAQMPLHTWLPDAMEGPTPVSALIHAATMVAAGVYLVGRCFALFAPEVLLVIAYTGAVTMFVAATIALVMTDIKRVLAYSTVSQLGLMMLALGVGGWVAGLLHLLTHAFFKALLFLGAGSVIHGCHHEQDLRKMGGLAKKMRTTALTMLVGVLAIAGTPFFSGWYSKDLVLQAALGFGLTHPQHIALFILPLLTAAMTAFYMFRLWFLAFAGAPRDHHVRDHAHESPLIMTLPLVILAAFSIGVAWGWPLWEVDHSLLAHALNHSAPSFLPTVYAHEYETAHHYHLAVGGAALLAAALGFGLAAIKYWKPRRAMVLGDIKPGTPANFLAKKWYFDELYDAVVLKPTVAIARFAGAFDKRPTEGTLAARRYDAATLDGWLNGLGDATLSAGRSLRRLQTGRLRSYILVLALTTAAMLAILTVLKT